MKHDNRSGPLDSSALHLLHRAGQCAEVLFTNEASKSDLTPRQFAVPRLRARRIPMSAKPAWSSRPGSTGPPWPMSSAGW